MNVFSFLSRRCYNVIIIHSSLNINKLNFISQRSGILSYFILLRLLFLMGEITTGKSGRRIVLCHREYGFEFNG